VSSGAASAYRADMSEFFMIFEPGLRHLVEERRRQKLEIKRPGDGAPPFGPVDLDSGVVYLDAETETEPEEHDDDLPGAVPEQP
jgi:Family of unknown function (DUF6191)